MDYKITNIKLSIKSSNYCLDTVQKKCKALNIDFKLFNNFIVIKNCFTYIIFKKSFKKQNRDNHINITKIDSFEKIPCTVKFLKNLQPDIILHLIKIDNITVSYNFKQFINIPILSKLALTNFYVTFNKETFPGLFLKSKKNYGTAIVFYTGKCVLLGSKNLNDVDNILLSLKNLVKIIKNGT